MTPMKTAELNVSLPLHETLQGRLGFSNRSRSTLVPIEPESAAFCERPISGRPVVAVVQASQASQGDRWTGSRGARPVGRGLLV